MDQDTFVFRVSFNRLESDAWIEHKPSPRGGYDLIGMGRTTEYDHKTGAVVSDKIEPTGIRGWASSEVFDGPKEPWWRRIFGEG